MRRPKAAWSYLWKARRPITTTAVPPCSWLGCLSAADPPMREVTMRLVLGDAMKAWQFLSPSRQGSAEMRSFSSQTLRHRIPADTAARLLIWQHAPEDEGICALFTAKKAVTVLACSAEWRASSAENNSGACTASSSGCGPGCVDQSLARRNLLTATVP